MQFIDTCEDGRVKVKITCINEHLNEEISVILNDGQIFISPFIGGDLAQLTITNSKGENSTLHGFFAGDIDSHDECKYIDGIVDSLTSGSTDCFFWKM